MYQSLPHLPVKTALIPHNLEKQLSLLTKRKKNKPNKVVQIFKNFVNKDGKYIIFGYRKHFIFLLNTINIKFTIELLCTTWRQLFITKNVSCIKCRKLKI